MDYKSEGKQAYETLTVVVETVLCICVGFEILIRIFLFGKKVLTSKYFYFDCFLVICYLVIGIIAMFHKESDRLDRVYEIVCAVLLWTRLVIQVARVIFVLFMVRKNLKQSVVLDHKISLLEDDLQKDDDGLPVNEYIDGEMVEKDSNERRSSAETFFDDSLYF